MGRGIIKLPLEAGRKELAWYAGFADTRGSTLTNPAINLKVERDADFVAKRLWLVQWPTYSGGIGTLDLTLGLPGGLTAVLKGSATNNRALSLVEGSTKGLFSECDPAKAASQWLGMPCPFLIKNNNTLYMEIANPFARTFQGDLYLVMEGFKVYPHLPEEFPNTLEVFALPFEMNANASINNPNSAPSYISGQVVKITNNGEGKFLAKGMKISIKDATGAEVTPAVLPCLAFNIVDSTSGTKRWAQNSSINNRGQFIPASIWNMHQSFLPWNMPRYIDQNGVVDVQVFFSDYAPALAYIGGAVTWPLTMHISLYGAILPR